MSCPRCSKGKMTIMKRFNFTNADLRCAAAVVCNAMLEQLPEPSECRHTFSDEFEQKMRELMDRKNHHHSAWHRVAQRAAAVILAVLLGLGAWLAVDQDARATVVRWIREVYENSIVYRFVGKTSEEKSYTYKFNWLPDGYEQVDQITAGDTQILIFQYLDETFTFTHHKASEDSFVKLIDMSTEGEPVKIRDFTGHYYSATDKESTNGLVWFDDRAGMYCSISAHLDYEDIMHIAESAKLVELTK